MKYNLKNKPTKFCSVLGGRCLVEPEVIEWFKGFEKELREKIRGCHRPCGMRDHQLVKEILGEEEVK